MRTLVPSLVHQNKAQTRFPHRGHCKPDQWRGFTKFERAFGAEQAIKILEVRPAHLYALRPLVLMNRLFAERTSDMGESGRIRARTPSAVRALGWRISRHAHQ